MPLTSRAIVLGASASLVAATPALGAEAGVAAVTATGGTLALVGLALIGVGAYALSRPRPDDVPTDSLTQAKAESAATVVRPVTGAEHRTVSGAAAAGKQALAYRGAMMEVSDEDEREPAYAGGGSPLGASGSDEVQSLLAQAARSHSNGDATVSDRDEIAEQMLAALKAEQARRAN